MDSYPNEFLAHPQPLMFVAGLTTAAQSSRTRSLSTVSNVSGSGFGTGSGTRSRRESSTVNTILSGSSTSGGSGLVSPRLAQDNDPAGQETLLPSPPPGGDSGEADKSAVLESDGPAESTTASDAVFETLVKDLRNALSDKAGKSNVWLPVTERKTFRIMLVDKAVRLPTRKVNSTVPSNSPNPEASTPHSPLSPLTPSSPCFPDGLIAPVWIRKHAELVPSVFVLFLRLYESPERSASSAAQTPEEIATREAKEKEMDDGLVREIGERRRRLGERGIKLTVVLMASAATLDSPGLDPRLSYLRRASALSSKASLFVLTPVPAEELPEFVQSLQDALYESAIEYYSQHSKRVKRKRSRLPNTASVSVQPGHAGKNLGPGGWAVRYEFKAAWFAEIRGDFDLARRHYEDCWNELARMFASTQTLPPRTKRWAEAKVLADCVAIRICRLLLYGDEAPRVLNPFFIHLKRFGELSRGWGIGEDTFEFWSWIARQYRILAELLELGIQSGAQIPTVPNPVFPTAAAAATVPSPDYFSTPISSLNPLHVLQPPAYYFYTAAVCSIQRQQRYEAALAVETDALSSKAGAASGYVSTSPGFASEKKVDHSALIVELLTKAYGLLNRADTNAHAHNRLALFVAYRIAETYCRSQQYDMAIKLFDRISPSFRKDQWSPIVREIRTLWYDCAQRTGNVETAAKLLLESLASGSGVLEEERSTTQDDLLTLLKTTSPAGPEPILLKQTAADSIFQVHGGFWDAESQVGASVPFQVVLTCPVDVHIDKIRFSSMEVQMSGKRRAIVIENDEASSEAGAVQIVKLGDVAGEVKHRASLCWQPGRKLVLIGSISSEEEEQVEISSVTLALKAGEWDIRLVMPLKQLLVWETGSKAITPLHGLSPILGFARKPLVVRLDVSHEASAYVGEPLPIKISITNDDERAIELEMSTALQPGHESDASKLSLHDGSSESEQLDGIDLGNLAPGQSTTKSLILSPAMMATKIVEISLMARPATTESGVAKTDALAEEFTKTVAIFVLDPFAISSTVRYLPSVRITTEDGKDNLTGEAIISSVITSPGPRTLKVESIEVVEADGSCTLVSSSLAGGVAAPQEWDQSSAFGFIAKFTVSPPRRASLAGVPSSQSASSLLKWRSASVANASLTQTLLALPPLTLPTRDSFLTATLDTPPTGQLNHPLILTLTIVNTHPTSSAADLSLQVDTADAFVWTGNRFAALPPVAPGNHLRVSFEVVPVGGTGWHALPAIRVWDGHGDEREEVVLASASGPSADGKRAMIYVRP